MSCKSHLEPKRHSRDNLIEKWLISNVTAVGAPTKTDNDFTCGSFWHFLAKFACFCG